MYLTIFVYQVEPDDGDTDENDTFDNKTSNVISSDDIPVADVKEIGNVTQVSIVDEVSTFLCLFLDELTSYVSVWFMSRIGMDSQIWIYKNIYQI